MKKPVIFLALLICFFFLGSGGFTPLLSPLLYTMTPFQRYYAGDYLASTWHRNDPTATTKTRLIWKSREGKLELATEQDVVPRPLWDLVGTYSPEPFVLSDKARAEGWTGLARGYPHATNSAQMEALLEEQVYGGNKLWRFCLQPALGLVTLTVLAFLIRAWRRERWQRNVWKSSREDRLSFWAWSVEAADRIARKLRPQGKFLDLPSPVSLPQLKLKAPSPQPVLAASVTPIQPLATQKNVMVERPGAPILARKPTAPQSVSKSNPVPAARPQPAFVWDESQGID